MDTKHFLIVLTSTLPLVVGFEPRAGAQEAPAPAPAPATGGAEGGETGAPPGAPTVIVVPGPTSTTTTTQTYPGGLPPQGWDPNGHLPSSSRAVNDINKGDTFDLGQPAGAGGPVRGSASGSYIVEGQFTPDNHTVRRGDTLWDISGQYYRNPYNWPRLWAINQQIQNPHWIYPGDRVRLREGGAPQGGSSTAGGIGLNRRRAMVPPQTVFLRDVGWIDDKNEDNWGELIGSPSDHMLLSEGNEVYLELGEGHDVSIGQELTLFRPLRDVESQENSDAKGTLVSIRGTVRIDRFNPKTHAARAEVIEAIDAIERGVLVGPVGRRFDVVPPTRNEQDIEARIMASIYPNQIFGQNQVVFIDKGEKDGVKPGNRFFAIVRADPWEKTIKKGGKMAQLRPMVEDDRPARVQPHFTDGDEEMFPDETYAELRVLRVRDHTATCLITAATHEVERTARLAARKGY